jgi:hypothetical protein
MDQSSYNPAHYMHKGRSTELSNTSKGRNNSSDVDFNIDDVKKSVTNLRKNADVSVNQVSGRLKDDYNLITKFETMLYETNSFDLLQKMIDDQFDNLETVIPGTIGAHFVGCNIDTSFSDTNPGCSAICAGSMPRKDKFWQSCNNSVIMAKNNNYGFDFDHLSVGRDKSHAHIFINYDTLEDFPGFTKEEKLKLSKMGIQYVYLHSHKNNDYNYDQLTDSAVHISTLKTRNGGGDHKKHKHHQESSEDNEDGWSWIWILVIVVFFVFLFIFLYLFLSADTKN